MLTDFNEWKYLPDLILENIFLLLSNRDRLNSSCVCREWNEVFYHPCLWKHYVYRSPEYLEKHSQRIYFDIATFNIKKRFKNVGYSFNSISIPTSSNYFMLNRALNIMAEFYLNSYRFYRNDTHINPLCDFRSKLTCFDFEFDSQIENNRLYGTGGALLTSIKRLLDNLENLSSMKLKSLLLLPDEREELLNEFIKNNKNSVLVLSLLDLTKIPYVEFDVMHFTNLTELELSPFQINGDLLVNLVQETEIRVLILTQTRFTLFPEEFVGAALIPAYVWQLALELHAARSPPDVNLVLHEKQLLTDVLEFSVPFLRIPLLQPPPAPLRRFVFASNNAALLEPSQLCLHRHSLTELVLLLDSAVDNSGLFWIDEELLQMPAQRLCTLILGGDRLSVSSGGLLQCLASPDHWPQLRLLHIQASSLQFGCSTTVPLPESLTQTALQLDLFSTWVAARLRLPSWNPLSAHQFSETLHVGHFFS